MRIHRAALLLAALAFSGSGHPGVAGPDADFLERAGRLLAEREYGPSRTERGFQAPNRAHALRTWFASDAVRVDERRSGRPLLTLRLASVGRDATLEPVGQGELSSAGARVEIRRGDLVEWYENSPRGLEQGFTFLVRPEGEGALALELDLEGATARMRGADAVLVAETGRRLSYGKLAAVDASGRILPSSMTASERAVRIQVDDAGANYPVMIDPLLASVADGRIEGGQISAHLANSVAGAGDVNGDGYADVIIGASRYDAGESDEGAAFVFHGGPAGIPDGDPTDAVTQLEGNEISAWFGATVAGAGDVNGDGYDDVLVSATLYDSGTTDGVAFLFHGSASGIASGGPASADGRIDPEPGTHIGSFVAGAGDVNGDGYDDVVVTTRVDLPAPAYGPVLVFHGGPAGIGNVNASADDGRLEPPASSAGFERVAGAGDVNGDGFADILAGAPRYAGTFVDEGAAYVFYGSGSGVGDRNAAAADLHIESGIANVRLGSSVAGAGDVNGDGLDDLIIGAPGAGNDQALIFHGGSIGSGGGSLASATTVISAGAGVDGLGAAVAGAGDVNGDGFGDVVVGAPTTAGGDGAAFVFLGRASGIPHGSSDGAAARIDGSLWDGGGLGASVAGAGDVNGDGLSDLVLGEPNYYTSYGGGAVDVVLGSTLTGSPVFQSDQAGAQLGSSVTGAGDVNGDGYDDVALGAPGYDTGSSQGAVFVFHGGPSGFAGTIPDAADAVLEAGTAGGFGEILAGAGDVNGDGYDDLAVVARAYTNGESEEGAVFVFHGGPTGLGDRSAALADAHVESDQPNARIGFVAGLGDVNGDGYDDLAIGAPDYDGSAEDQGAVFVFHGSPFGIPDGNLSGAATQIGATPDFFYLGWPIAGAGDVNGDGYDDLVVGLQQDFGFQRSAAIFHGSAAGIPSGDVSGAPGYVESLDPFSYYGATAVSGAGDVNGDGYDDLLVAFPSYSEYDDVPGAAFVFHGGSSGIVGVSSDTADTVLQASAPGTSFGSFASGAGDVDGDGYDDVVVAASHEAGMGDDEGAFYVFRGGPGGVADGGPATSWRHVAGQQTGGWFGTGVSRAGDVNGDGRADVIAGAPFYDAGQWDEGIALVFLPEPGAPAGVAAALLLLAALRRARRACAP